MFYVFFHSYLDGVRGITVYRRTKIAGGRHNEKNDPSEYIVGVGVHKGIISSQDWIRVQNIVGKRGHLGIRKATGRYGLLNGVLRCNVCGDYMKPTCIRNNTFSYKCLTKEKSRGALCNVKNLKHTVDSQVIGVVTELLKTDSAFASDLKSSEKKLDKDSKNNKAMMAKIKKQINDNQKAITNLVMRLSKVDSETLLDHITEQVEKLDAETKSLKNELILLEEKRHTDESEQMNLSAVKNAVEKLKDSSFAGIEDMLVKRNMLKTIVRSIYWDGDNIDIGFF